MSLALLLLFPCGSMRAEDWPTYMHDNQRSGVTGEELEAPLSLKWVFTPSAPPAKGWSDYRRNYNRVAYDDAPHVVTAGSVACFASSGEQKVYGLDVRTGEELWSVCLPAPARMAPAIVGTSVLFGCDDGKVRCLDLGSGHAQWTVETAPGERQVLGHGRMMSLWPVRTGIAISGGVAYVGAGLFPFHSKRLIALDVHDGSPVWARDLQGEMSPQGYMLLARDTIILPSGRSPPRVYELKDGARKATCGYLGKGSGGAQASVAGDNLFNLQQQTLVVYSVTDGSHILTWPAVEIALSHDGTAYVYMKPTGSPESKSSGTINTADVIKSEIHAVRFADMLASNEELLKLLQKLDKAMRYGGSGSRNVVDLGKQTNAKLDQASVWRLGCGRIFSMILAGDTLLAGEQDGVFAADAGNGKRQWETAIDGGARGLAYANGRLFVSVTDGRVYCLDADDGGEVMRVGARPKVAGTSEADARTAEAIIETTGIAKGYVFVSGDSEGNLSRALIRESDLYVFAHEPSPTRAESLRRTFADQGIHGSRVSVLEGAVRSLPPLFANVVVSQTAGMAAEDMLHVLRPYGGRLVIDDSLAADVAYRRELEPAGKIDDRTSVLIRGRLRGDGEWSHQWGDTANTGSSSDMLVKPPFQVLWFGDPGPDLMYWRHNQPAGPLVAGGRLFIQGKDFGVYDLYNGTKLWSRTVDRAWRFGAQLDAGNMAACEDRLFIALADQGACVQLHAGTGRELRRYSVPRRKEGGEPRWAWLAVSGTTVFGTRGLTERTGTSPAGRQYTSLRDLAPYRSECVFALDAGNGETRWIHERGVIPNQGVAVDKTTLYLVDMDVQRERFDVPVRVVALDALTGREKWSTVLDASPCFVNPQKSKLYAAGELNLIATHGMVLLCTYPWVKGVAGDYSKRSVIALGAKDGRQLWIQQTGHDARPIVVRDALFASPGFYSMVSGAPLTVEDDDGRSRIPWKVRSGLCVAPTASARALFFRSGYHKYYDIEERRLETLEGLRPGCGVSMVGANGVLALPASSEGCECRWNILKCTMVLHPE